MNEVMEILAGAMIGWVAGYAIFHMAILPLWKYRDSKVAEPQVIDILKSSDSVSLTGIWMKLEVFVMKDQVKQALDRLVREGKVVRNMVDGDARYKIGDSGR